MKHLYRSKKNRIFAGVIGGVAEYLEVDPVFVRLVWLLILIGTGLVPGIIVYFIAMLIVPEHQGPHIHEHHTS